MNRFKAFHPGIDEILKVINCYHCNLHVDRILTTQHLAEHGVVLCPGDLVGFSKQHVFDFNSERVLGLKGAKRGYK